MLTTLLLPFLALHAGITCEMKAARLPAALKVLSQKAGMELTCQPTIEDKILLLSVHGMTSEKLMERIAEATCGKWTAVGSGFKLLYDSKRAEAKEKAAVDRVAARIAKSLEKLSSMKFEPFTEARAQLLAERLKQYDALEDSKDMKERQGAYELMESLKRDMPAQRAAYKIAAMLDPKLLASFPRGRMALSDRPTRMEYPLPGAARGVLETLAKEHATWLKVVNALPASDAPSSHRLVDPRYMKDPLDASKLRIFVQVDKSSRQDIQNVTVWFADETNYVVAFGEMNVMDGGPAPAAGATPPKENTTPVTLSPAAQTRIEALMADHKPGEPGVDGELKRQLLDPVTYEPLSFAPSELILQAAKADSEDVVACLPDEAENLNYVFSKWTKPEKRTIGEVWRGIRRVCDVTVADGCVTLAPKSSSIPVSRQALALFAKDVDTNGVVRLEPAADFAAQRDFDSLPLLAYWTIDALVPGSAVVSGRMWGSELHLYGLLPLELRKRLRDGNPVSLRQLPAEALAQLQRLVYVEHRSFNVHIERRGTPRGTGISLFNEAVEALPDGLDPNAQMTLTVSRLKAVMATGDGALGYSPYDSMQLRSLAAQILSPTIPALKNYTALRGQTILSVLPGYESSFMLEFAFSPEVRANAYLFDQEYDLRKKGGAIEALPDDYKKELDFQIADLKRMHGGG